VEGGLSLTPSDGREVDQEVLERVAAAQIVEKILDGHPRSHEDRYVAEVSGSEWTMSSSLIGMGPPKPIYTRNG